MTDLQKLVEQWCGECGFTSWNEWPEYRENWEAVARLAMQHAAEEAAKVCKDYAERHAKDDDDSKARAWMMLQCAAAIREHFKAL